MDWISELNALMPPPPAEQRRVDWSADDWARVEVDLGRPIPADFRAFINGWGAGRLGDFLSPYVPAGPYHPAIVMPAAVRGPAGDYAMLKSPHPGFTLPDFPADGSLMTFAVTDNGDYLGWIVGPGDPGSWPVAIWGDEERAAEVFDGESFGPFIVQLVQGGIRPAAFPDDLWDDSPWAFEPRSPRP